MKYIGERAYVSIDDDGAGDLAIDEIVFAEAPAPNAQARCYFPIWNGATLVQ